MVLACITCTRVNRAGEDCSWRSLSLPPPYCVNPTPIKVKVSSEGGDLVLQFANPPGAVAYVHLSPQVIMVMIILAITLLSVLILALVNPCKYLEPFP